MKVIFHVNSPCPFLLSLFPAFLPALHDMPLSWFSWIKMLLIFLMSSLPFLITFLTFSPGVLSLSVLKDLLACCWMCLPNVQLWFVISLNRNTQGCPHSTKEWENSYSLNSSFSFASTWSILQLYLAFLTHSRAQLFPNILSAFPF